MAPPFDFDLNELPPPENDGVDGISEAPVPEPSAHQDPLLTEPVPEPSSAQQDPLLVAPVPETSSQQDPLLAEPVSSEHSAQQDPRPPAAPVPAPTTAHVPLMPVRSIAPAPEEASPVDPFPAPLRAPVPPVPSPRHDLPSPVLDLEAPLSSLDDEDEDEADLPLPPPPPLPLPPPPPLPSWYLADTSDAPTVSSGRQGDAARDHSSPETWAPRGSSRMATASDTTSSHRSRRRPYSCDDAISRQRRRVVDDYDEDGGSSSRGGGGRRRRSELGSPPPRYERSGPAPPRRYFEQQDGGRHAPAADAQPGGPARNRRRRRRAQQRLQHGYRQYEGPVQKQQGRGREQQQLCLRGQERPQVHHGPHHGPEVPKVGYASYSPPSGSFVRRDSPEQERGTGWESWDRRPCREKDAPPFRPSPPSARPRGREDPLYHGRQSQAQEPPKVGGYEHRDNREAPSFRPSSTGAHGGGRDDGSYGGRRHIPEENCITGGAHHQQQTKAPRGRDEQFTDRAYHPYARRGSGFDRPAPDDGGGGRNPARREREPGRDSYEHRRYSKQQLRSGGSAACGLRYYGDTQE